MNQNANAYLGTENIGRLMRKFSVPCIMSLLVSSLYNIVDQIFIGRGVGYLGNGATNVVFPITVLTLALALMIGDGCAAFLSICQGKGDKEDAHRSVGNAVFLSVLIGIVFTILFVVLKEKILMTFGATENNIDYAIEYFDYLVIGIPFYMFTSSMNSIIRADGSPQYAMFSTLIGCVINLIFDPIAIFVFHWGMMGAAVATITGQIVTAILAFVYLFHTKSFQLQKESFRLNGEILRKIIPLGISSFLTQISIVVIMAVMNNTMVAYGAKSEYGADIPMTVIGIVMKVFQIVIAFVIGIAAGCQPIVGYNYGAGHIDRVKELFKKMMMAEAIIGVISMAAFELFPIQIIRLFGSEPGLYEEFAGMAFRIYLFTIILCCFQKAIAVFLQAMGKPAMAMGLSLFRELFIAVVFILIFAKAGGVVGVLYSAPAADVLAGIVAAVFVKKLFKDISLNSNAI